MQRLVAFGISAREIAMKDLLLQRLLEGIVPIGT